MQNICLLMAPEKSPQRLQALLETETLVHPLPKKSLPMTPHPSKND